MFHFYVGSIKPSIIQQNDVTCHLCLFRLFLCIKMVGKVLCMFVICSDILVED